MTRIEEIERLYQLSESENERIGALIIEDFTEGVTSVDAPMAIVLGGQPGSGKSELITQAQVVTGKNAVICNADDYRDYHPKSKEIKKNYEEYYPEITVKYSQPWNNRLKEYCETNRLSYILETTFSSGDRMNQTIRTLKEKNYFVYIMILAVNKRLSFLGTRLRYEGMKASAGYGRLVDQEIHDEKYEMVLTTLQAVHKAHLYDKLVIFGRAGRQKVKGMHNGLVRISENGEDPVKDYQTEREKEWSDNDLRFFNDDVLYLVRQMVDRRAPYEDIKNVLDSFQVGLKRN
jgi:predicted ABC-type ATPase